MKLHRYVGSIATEKAEIAHVRNRPAYCAVHKFSVLEATK